MSIKELKAEVKRTARLAKEARERATQLADEARDVAAFADLAEENAAIALAMLQEKQSPVKRFTVTFRRLVTVEVEALTEGEAIEKASDEAESSAGGWETTDIQVTEEKE